MPTCGHELFFYPDENEAAIEAERQALYKQAWRKIDDWAHAFKEDLFTASQQPSSETNEEYRQKVTADFRAAVSEKISALKAQQEAFEKLGEWEQFWENSKSAGEGVVGGITDYVPDLGEFGELMDKLDIDTSALIDAIATGNVDALEKKFQEWGKRGGANFEAATLAMEALIILVSDAETRKLLASLPLKFLEVTPEDQLVEIGVSQGTQTGIDIALVGGATVLGTAAGGVGGPLAGGAATVGTLLRKSGKLLEAIIDILMELAAVLKKKRNQNIQANQGYNPQHPEKTILPQGGSQTQQQQKKEPDVSVRILEGDEATVRFSGKQEDIKPESMTLHAIGAPAGGNYSWDVNSSDFDFDANGDEVTITPKKPGKSIVKVTYAHANGTATDRITINIEGRNSIFLHVFEGEIRVALANLKKKFNLEESGVDPQYTDFDFLRATGHVGFSFEDKNKIYGFNPDVSAFFEKETGHQIFRRIKDREKFSGKISNDTDVFTSAKQAGLDVIIVEYRMSTSKFDKMKSEFIQARKTPGQYSFPDKQGNVTGMENCATWPTKFGLPIPEETGEIKVYATKAKLLRSKVQEVD